MPSTWRDKVPRQSRRCNKFSRALKASLLSFESIVQRRYKQAASRIRLGWSEIATGENRSLAHTQSAWLGSRDEAMSSQVGEPEGQRPSRTLHLRQWNLRADLETFDEELARDRNKLD
jgi:hypothetical protein